MARRGKSKTLNQATDQLNRITDYYERTGRGETARRIRKGSMSVGGVIGNMADRVSMRGGDPFTRAGMNTKVSFRDRTTTPTDAEYENALVRNNLRKAGNNIARRRNFMSARAQTKASTKVKGAIAG